MYKTQEIHFEISAEGHYSIDRKGIKHLSHYLADLEVSRQMNRCATLVPQSSMNYAIGGVPCHASHTVSFGPAQAPKVYQFHRMFRRCHPSAKGNDTRVHVYIKLASKSESISIP